MADKLHTYKAALEAIATGGFEGAGNLASSGSWKAFAKALQELATEALNVKRS